MKNFNFLCYNTYRLCNPTSTILIYSFYFLGTALKSVHGECQYATETEANAVCLLGGNKDYKSVEQNGRIFNSRVERFDLTNL